MFLMNKINLSLKEINNVYEKDIKNDINLWNEFVRVSMLELCTTMH